MEQILIKYLKTFLKYEIIIIDYYEFNDSDCNVIYFTDIFKIDKETIKINIWDFITFLINSTN